MSEKYRATVYVNRDLWGWVRKHAIDKHQSASEVIEELIRTYKSEQIEPDAKEALSVRNRAKTAKRR